MRIIFDLTEFNDFIKTTDDVNKFLGLLTNLSEELFKTDENFATIINKQAPYAVSQTLRDLAKRYQVDSDDKADVALFLRHLKEAVVSLPAVNLTLAFAPKKDLIEEMSEWFLTNYQTTVLFNIKVDPEIIGGALFSFNGKYRDYSLKKKLGEMQQNKFL